MKRTTIVLSAAALSGLSAAAFGGGSQNVPNTGWQAILGYQPVSLTEDAALRQQAIAPSVVLAANGICDGLNDNGPYNPDDPNGNGYSNGTLKNFGAHRTLLDDFEVPNGVRWTLNEHHHTHVWDTEQPGSGNAMEIAIWTDSAGQPDAPLMKAFLSSSYTEVATGNTFFGRPEAASWAGFEPIVLDAGRYWFETAVAGPENNFWMTADQNGSEVWTNWDDQDPPLQPGRAIFGGLGIDVNWCLSGSEEAGGPSNQFGLKHTPTGDATLTVDPGTLTVTNIGSSGLDGVSVELGNSSGGWVGHSAALSAGTVRVTPIAIVDGTPDTRLASMTTTLDASSSVTLELPADGQSFTANLYLDGALVSSTSLPYGAAAATTSDSLPGGNSVLRRQADRVAYLIELDSAINEDGAGMIDTIEMIPNDAQGVSVDGVTHAETTAADTGDIVYDRQSIVMFGNVHTRFGIGKLTTLDGGLRVSNLGSSGEDGVLIDINDAEALDAVIDPVVVNTGTDRIDLSATGCFEDTAGSELGSTSIISGGGFTVMSGDFAPISGGNQVRVALYDDGKFVVDIIRNGGQFMFLGPEGEKIPFPSVIGVGYRAAGETGFNYHFDGDFNLQTGSQPGTTIGLGDELRVLTEDPDSPVTAMDSLTLTTNKGPAVLITSETVTGEGVGCAGAKGCDPNGDANGDGCVNFTDILDVLGNWDDEGEPGILGDSDCSGVVDFNDILNVLATFLSEACE